MHEQWRPIPGFVGYEASSEGRIRSTDRVVTYETSDGRLISRHHKSRVLAQMVAKSTGYSYVSPGRKKTIYVHRAIALAFRGVPPTPKHHAAHGDGDHSNNRLSNIAWKTAVENEEDKLRHGRRYQGTAHHLNKLSEDDVREIRRQMAIGHRIRAKLAREYGVHPSTIGKIHSRQIWRHLR